MSKDNVPVYVGLDYHSRRIQVCVVEKDGRVRLNRSCPSDPAAVVRLVGMDAPVDRVAIEMCAGAATFADELEEATGWRVSLGHPGYVKRMKNSPDKSDHGDARVLADLCRTDFLPEVWSPTPRIRDLRALVRYRAQAVERRKQTKLRILAIVRQLRLAEPAVGRWSRPWLAWLRSTPEPSRAVRWILEGHLEELRRAATDIDAIEKVIEELVADDPVVDRLLAVAGVGRVTAWTMRAFIGRFDRFATGKQPARFCAVTPRNASSGERVADAGMVKAGDPLLKTVIIQAAQRLRRHEPRWKAMSMQMSERGKAASTIIGAVANRWIRRLHHEMREAGMASA